MRKLILALSLLVVPASVQACDDVVALRVRGSYGRSAVVLNSRARFRGHGRQAIVVNQRRSIAGDVLDAVFGRRQQIVIVD